MSFQAYLEKNSPRIGELILNSIKNDSYEDINRYLYEPLSRYSANGGKRHRPLVCELACGAVGGDPSLVSEAAIAVEHFHTAALIHDDIADESTLRRGETCLHISEGEGLAINAGDLALSQVTGSVLADTRLSESLQIRVLRELVTMTTRTIEGQALDIGWARDGRFDLSIDDYFIMARRKTAYYSGGTPLAIGAIIGGGSESQIEILRAYGMATGLAFQIQDDLLNLMGNKDLLGKDYRSDITEGKRTLIAVHALQNSQKSDELTSILASHATEPAVLSSAVDIMESAGSVDFARSYAVDLVASAKVEIADKLEDNEYTKLLMQMADFFIDRMN